MRGSRCFGNKLKLTPPRQNTGDPPRALLKPLHFNWNVTAIRCQVLKIGTSGKAATTCYLGDQPRRKTVAVLREGSRKSRDRPGCDKVESSTRTRLRALLFALRRILVGRLTFLCNAGLRPEMGKLEIRAQRTCRVVPVGSEAWLTAFFELKSPCTGVR